MARIGILGAGTVGCYLGGRLIAAGGDVVLVGRARLKGEIEAAGLTLTDHLEHRIVLAADRVAFSLDPAALASADLVLVAVKSADTGEAGRLLQRYASAHALCVSLQNGIGNAATLREAAPGRTILSGMVPFNVLQHGPAAFHQGMPGQLMIERHPGLDAYMDLFDAAGTPIAPRDDMAAVQWGKLLLNLNNAVNALCGLPLRQELGQRAYRRCLALAQQEAITTLAAAGMAPARLTPLPPRLITRVLGLPDWAFAQVGRRTLAIDPLARSSMWEDLEQGRRTEVDWLNGEIVRLAQTLGRPAPVNAALVALIRAAEAGGRRDWTGQALLARLRAAATP